MEPQQGRPNHRRRCGDNRGDAVRFTEHVREQAAVMFKQRVGEHDAALRMDLRRFRKWTLPERPVAIVDKCYRDLRGEPDDAPVDALAMLARMGKLRDAWSRRAGA
jgi:hypothetical protein